MVRAAPACARLLYYNCVVPLYYRLSNVDRTLFWTTRGTRQGTSTLGVAPLPQVAVLPARSLNSSIVSYQQRCQKAAYLPAKNEVQRGADSSEGSIDFVLRLSPSPPETETQPPLQKVKRSPLSATRGSLFTVPIHDALVGSTTYPYV